MILKLGADNAVLYVRADIINVENKGSHKSICIETFDGKSPKHTYLVGPKELRGAYDIGWLLDAGKTADAIRW